MIDGWLHTGNAYIPDGEGYFHCRRRNDDIPKVGGIWRSPFEIEKRRSVKLSALSSGDVEDKQRLII